MWGCDIDWKMKLDRIVEMRRQKSRKCRRGTGMGGSKLASVTGIPNRTKSPIRVFVRRRTPVKGGI